MEFRIHNTASGKKETFKPLNPDRIGMYLCGPTVYDYIHIGNARPLVVFDVLYRYLRYRYREVTYVRNITDVDDKINARAKEEGVTILELTSNTAKQFRKDAKSLNCLRPTNEPRATGNISKMIKIIEKLIEKNHAYVAEDHVLFDVKSMPNYGQFARMSENELLDGARVEQAPFKRNPQDFVLWKPSSKDLPGWDNPWNNRGRPGWHIECSAMSRAYLGGSFDLHLGGQDLIFPHHQNEIAQSCCAFPDEAFARYWMHNGYLLSEGEKMSKSLGNFYTVQDLLQEYPGEAIRFLLLQTHYRSPLDFSKEKLAEAVSTLNKFYTAINEFDEYNNHPLDSDGYYSFSSAQLILEALSDDLNTPLALYHFHKSLNEFKTNKNYKNYLAVRQGADILGILQNTYPKWLREMRKQMTFFRDSDIKLGTKVKAEHKRLEKSLATKEIRKAISDRKKAKSSGDYASADKIRDELKAKGIELQDGSNGKTTWRYF